MFKIAWRCWKWPPKTLNGWIYSLLPWWKDGKKKKSSNEDRNCHEFVPLLGPCVSDCPTRGVTDMIFLYFGIKLPFAGSICYLPDKEKSETWSSNKQRLKCFCFLSLINYILHKYSYFTKFKLNLVNLTDNWPLRLICACNSCNKSLALLTENSYM